MCRNFTPFSTGEFQSTLSMRRATVYQSPEAVVETFQSTLSMRRATFGAGVHR